MANEIKGLVNITTGTEIADADARYGAKTFAMFSAYNPSSLLNKTGDDTVYTIPFSSTDVNIGSYYNTTTGVFTAPVDGVYSFGCNLYLDGLWTAHTEQIVQVVRAGAAAANWNILDADLLDIRFNIVGGYGDILLSGYQRFYMEAGDTSRFQLTVLGTSKIVDINQGSNFSGALDMEVV